MLHLESARRVPSWTTGSWKMLWDSELPAPFYHQFPAWLCGKLRWLCGILQFTCLKETSIETLLDTIIWSRVCWYEGIHRSSPNVYIWIICVCVLTNKSHWCSIINKFTCKTWNVVNRWNVCSYQIYDNQRQEGRLQRVSCFVHHLFSPLTLIGVFFQ